MTKLLTHQNNNHIDRAKNLCHKWMYATLFTYSSNSKRHLLTEAFFILFCKNNNIHIQLFSRFIWVELYRQKKCTHFLNFWIFPQSYSNTFFLKYLNQLRNNLQIFLNIELHIFYYQSSHFGGHFWGFWRMLFFYRKIECPEIKNGLKKCWRWKCNTI